MAPDPRRVGGIEWTRSTGGVLTRRERLRLGAEVARGQARALAGRLALATGRRARTSPEIPPVPDSALARAAEEACAEQPAPLAAHARRTWVYGRALAAVDGETRLDEELFYVACLLHDAGLVEATAGEDFTLRSAARAAACAAGHRHHDDIVRLEDAVTVHTTPGIRADRDGAEGTYVQAGAVLDLGGLRLEHLPAALVAATLAEHPRTGVTAAITDLVRAEARAVPLGRFALLRRTGFLAAVAIAPFDQR